MKEIVKIDAVSAGKIQALFVVFFALVIGAIFILVGLLTMIFSLGTGAIILAIGFGIAILGSIGYGISMFIFGLLYAFIYNLLTRMFGGMKVEFK
jgi:hypothetical protein